VERELGGLVGSGATRWDEERGVPVARGERGRGVFRRLRRASGGDGSRLYDAIASNRGAGSSTCGASATVLSSMVKFDSISNFKRIQIIIKFFQALTDQKK
jgi:hypothetical protein